VSRQELALDATAAVVEVILTEMPAFRPAGIILPQDRPTRTLYAEFIVQAGG
jgi:hypothetical protein